MEITKSFVSAGQRLEHERLKLIFVEMGGENYYPLVVTAKAFAGLPTLETYPVHDYRHFVTKESESALETRRTKIGQDLRGGDFTHSNLQEPNLENADLRNAIFKNVNIRGANLQGADLRNANLEGANLRGPTSDART